MVLDDEVSIPDVFDVDVNLSLIPDAFQDRAISDCSEVFDLIMRTICGDSRATIRERFGEIKGIGDLKAFLLGRIQAITVMWTHVIIEIKRGPMRGVVVDRIFLRQ